MCFYEQHPWRQNTRNHTCTDVGSAAPVSSSYGFSSDVVGEHASLSLFRDAVARFAAPSLVTTLLELPGHVRR
jgi:hypothetical protein